jgi:hypothetical protein
MKQGLNPLRVTMISAALCLFVFAQPAHAYVDPGSASFFVQILIGSLLGAVFAVKPYWKNLKEYIRGRAWRTKR